MNSTIALTMDAALLQLDARAQAAAIRCGRLTAAQLVAAQMQAIDARNPQINAFVQRLPGNPLQNASTRQIQPSALAGATFAVKDNIDVAGLPTHAGLRALAAQPAQTDALAIARLRQAGMVLLGKLNMHAMALGASNHNEDFGHCYHPLRPGYSPGGSSGGSAAAVAAGMCSLALGTDTMGSVRVPAAYCGVVGFKPSFDAIPVDGLLTLSTTLDHIGVLARSVGDCAEAFAWLSTGSPPTADSPPGGNFSFAYPRDIAALGAEPEVCAAFAAALDRMRSQGFALQAVDIDAAQLPRIRHAGLLLCEAELADAMAPVLAERRDQIPAYLLQMLDFGARLSSAKLSQALRCAVQASRWITALMADYDALLLPTTPQTSFSMQADVPRNQPDFTAPANMNGAPAISLPLPVGPAAMPIGLQLIGQRGADCALLRAAARIESALAE